MTKRKLNGCDDILSDIETMMGTESVARLTPNQFVDIEAIHAELKKACAIGNRRDAERAQKLIHAIVAEGAPVR
jgi:DNA-binding GntR family transcriptional regulator